jgi:hypothetical protein
MDLKIRIKTQNDRIYMLKLLANQIKELYRNQKKVISNDEVSRLIGYVCHFCNIFNDYNNKTIETLDSIDDVYPLLFAYDNSIYKKLLSLKISITQRLNHSEIIIMKTIMIVKNLKKHLEQKSSNFFSNIFNIKISKMSRLMLNNYEIGLKYIPQIYFESIKILRSYWYHYETKYSLENF